MNFQGNEGCAGSTSARLGEAFIHGLVAAGVHDFVISPGSRSTPLVLALSSRRDVRSRVVLDERSAGFFALGLADRLHQPIAVVCTSGTACANYLPAVIEASYRRVPLLLLTADRPPELRDCGAGQTIHQVGLFGEYVRWEVDACAPGGSEGEVYHRQIGLQAVKQACGPVSGPVHINLPFREPFLPPVKTVEDRWRRPEDWTQPLSGIDESLLEFDWKALKAEGSGWIVAGPANPANPARWANRLFELSDYLGWPIFADVTNPARHSPGSQERVVTQYEGLLSAGITERKPETAPEAILQVGPLPTAKPLRQWLNHFRGKRWQWSDDPACLDPSRSGAIWIPGNPARLGEIPGDFSEDSYRGHWMDLEHNSTERVAAWIEETAGGYDGKVHRRIAETVAPGMQVFFANSLPVRDAERFWFADRNGGPRVFSNRGASGIDGLVSTVAGLADKGPPTLAVLGDLSFLHDCGGLRVAAQVEGQLTLLVLNNGGGRIFSQLPISEEDGIFEEYFLTPQDVDLHGLCAAHGLASSKVAAADELVELLRWDFQGTRVLIFETDTSADSKCRGEWEKLFSLGDSG